MSDGLNSWPMDEMGALLKTLKRLDSVAKEEF